MSHHSGDSDEHGTGVDRFAADGASRDGGSRRHRHCRTDPDAAAASVIHCGDLIWRSFGVPRGCRKRRGGLSAPWSSGTDSAEGRRGDRGRRAGKSSGSGEQPRTAGRGTGSKRRLRNLRLVALLGFSRGPWSYRTGPLKCEKSLTRYYRLATPARHTLLFIQHIVIPIHLPVTAGPTMHWLAFLQTKSQN